LNQYPAAERLLKHTAQLMADTLGETHPETLNTKSALAEVYRLLGRYDEAAQMQSSVVDGLKLMMGSDHASVLAATANVARIYRKQRRFTEAEVLLSEVIRKQRKLYGGRHPVTLVSIHELTFLLSDAGKLEEVENVQRCSACDDKGVGSPSPKYTTSAKLFWSKPTEARPFARSSGRVDGCTLFATVCGGA
jgi:tetratricopeptide (TPR) repeat protein